MIAGLDEAGRGPLFGRVYAAAVILNDGFDVTRVKDSKKFSSEKKRSEAAEYIRANSIWKVAYMDETVIDKVNILQATMWAMREAVLGIPAGSLLVDGNYFKPVYRLNGDETEMIPFQCVEKGDAIHPCISAASILAKVDHDDYIREMCALHPDLEKYDLLKNKGYGTRSHLDAIKKYGLTQWHRKSFKIKC
jgi:ribonuclease HII